MRLRGSLRATLLVAASSSFLLGGLALAPGAGADPGDTATALQQGKLVTFDPEAPGTFTSTVPVTGIPSTEGIRDLALRPADGQLYALTGPTGFGASGPERVYRIDAITGAATLAATLSVDLPGTQHAIAFNPCVDRLRVVGVTDQTNYRVNVATGETIVDGNLAYVAGDPNAGVTPRIAGIGYTAATPGPGCATVLYDFDLRDALSSNPKRVLTIQDANPGILTTVGTVTAPITAFGADFSIGRLGGTEVGYLTGSTGDLNQSQVFRVDLGSGAASATGPAGARIANGPVGGLVIRRALGPPPVIPEFPSAVLPVAVALIAGAWFLAHRRASVIAP